MKRIARALLPLAAVACSGATESTKDASPVGTYAMIAYDDLSLPARVYSDTSGDGIWITSGSLTLLSSGGFALQQRESTYTSISRAGEVDTLRSAGQWKIPALLPQ